MSIGWTGEWESQWQSSPPGEYSQARASPQDCLRSDDPGDIKQCVEGRILSKLTGREILELFPIVAIIIQFPQILISG